ncbi:flagellar biosynthesis protein FlgA [Mycobacterium sp. ACS1612]|uniref:SAF domain-containing protein n=1 Tax=Mycobacterium sp. ACS1612 TaxID=1834117 RepID=UPI0008008873|nr:SAF domain-containing protein [Mycobacterium sp. ACS1612]OBF26045.1 flagellar biosynthesis protein FlgA [Mycobacterium sp. ACS1612]
MGDSLNPSMLSRLLAARPDWSRTLAARRMAAGALVVLAAVVAVRSNPQGERTDVVVAARDLASGVALTADDVRMENRSAATVPDGARADVGAVLGATLAGPARRGEVLTDVRVLGPRLAGAVAGPDARIVPLPLADSAVLDLVRPGDVVDVLAAGSDADSQTQLVATDAVVVVVSEKPKGAAAGGDRVVLVALPGHAANKVAAATLLQTVTLTFH